jgi:hypothetical protein
VFSCVGSGFTIGLITRVLPTDCKDSQLQTNLCDGNRPEGLIRKVEEEEEKVKEEFHILNLSVVSV